MPGMTATANPAESPAVADLAYAPSRAKPLVSAILVTIFVFAVFVGGTHPGISETGIRMFSGAIALAVLVGWAIVAIIRPTWRPQSALLLPIAVAVTLFCLAALFSQAPRLSEDAILQAGALVVAFLLVSRLAADPFYRIRMMWLVAGVTVVVAAAYAAHVLLSWISWWSLIGRVTVPPLRPFPSDVADLSPLLSNVLTRLNLGAVNLTAAVVILAMPFAVALVVPRSRAAAVALTILAVFVLVASASRGALVGAGFAVVAAIGLWVLTVGRESRSGRSIRRIPGRRRVVVGLIAAALSIGLVVLLAPAVVGRFAVGIDEARLSIYESTIRMIAADPIVGTGPGTWSLLH
jgi:O-antigen ligase